MEQNKITFSDEILPNGTKLYVRGFGSSDIYEIVGYSREAKDGLFKIYYAYKLKSDLSGVKGRKKEIGFPTKPIKSNWTYLATLPDENQPLISQNEIDSENRRNQQEEEVLKWDGIKPVYLMTKEEYKKDVTPIIKKFIKFKKDNSDVLNDENWYIFRVYDFNTFKKSHKPRKKWKDIFSTAEEDFIGVNRDIREVKQATDKQVKELNDFLDYFKLIFPNILVVEPDEVNSNKRSMRRAIDDGTYEKLLREGKINFTFLKNIFDSVGFNVPSKLEKVEKEVVEMGLTSDVVEKNINNTEEFTNNLKSFFSDAISYYKDKFFEKYVVSLNNINDFYKNNKDVKFDDFLQYKKNYYISNGYEVKEVLGKRTNRIIDYVSANEDIELYEDIQKHILDKDYYNKYNSIKLVDNYIYVLNGLAESYSDDLFNKLAERILNTTKPLNDLSNTFPKIKYAYIYSLTSKGFVCILDLVYPNGFVLSIETDVIMAGGYNIQVLHIRGLIKLKNKGKFMPIESILNNYKEYDKNTDLQKQTFIAKDYDKKYNKGGLIAPNGKPSNLTPEQYKLVRTPSFKEWFGDWENDPANASKVVDENGEPLVVYHGTNAEFNVFDTDEDSTNRKGGNWNAEYPDGYIFMISDKKNAKYYGKKIIPLFVNMVYPTIKKVKKGESLVLPFDDEGLAYEGDAIVTDGIDYVVGTQDEFAVKLADGTNTTFNGNNPDIRFDGGGVIENEIDKSIDGVVNSNSAKKRIYFDDEINGFNKFGYAGDIDCIETIEGVQPEFYTLNGKRMKWSKFGDKSREHTVVNLISYDGNGEANGILKIVTKGDEIGLNKEGLFKIVVRDKRSGVAKKLLDRAYNIGIDLVKYMPINSYSPQGRSMAIKWLKNLKEEIKSKRYDRGGEITKDEKDELYKEWKSLVNMTYSELSKFMKTKEGKEAGLSQKQADELGIKSGQESAKWILKMKRTKKDKWTPTMWDWAKRQINFIKRMSGNEGKLYDEKGNKTRKHTSLLIWGHNPEKYSLGGNLAQRIYTSENSSLPNKSKLQEAKSLLEKGKDNEYIRSKTGWFLNPFDNKWRYEIDDSDLSIKIENNIGETTLGKFIEHKKLFEAYPKIKYVKVFLGENGLIYPNITSSKDEITFNINIEKVLKDENIGKIQSSLRTNKSKQSYIDRHRFGFKRVEGIIAHELQHIVQQIEGLAVGSNPINELRKIARERNINLNEIDRDKRIAIEIEAYNRYLASSGEIEAQDVDVRIKMDKNELKSIEPYNSIKKPFKTNTSFEYFNNKKYLNKGGEMEKDKKYVAQSDFMVYAKNDEEAKREAQEIMKMIEDKYDNNPKVQHLFEVYRGIGNNRKVFKDGGLIAPNGKPSNLTPEQYRLVRTPEFKAWFGDWENDPENASKVVDENGEPLVVYHGTFIEKGTGEWYEFSLKNTRYSDVGFHFGTRFAAQERINDIIRNETDAEYSFMARGRDVSKPRILAVFLNIKNLIRLEEHNRMPSWRGIEVLNKIFDSIESGIADKNITQAFQDDIESHYDSELTVRYDEYGDGNLSEDEEEYPHYSDNAEKENRWIEAYLNSKGFNGIVYKNTVEDKDSDSFIVFSSNQIKLADGTNTTFDGSNPDIRFKDGGSLGEYEGENQFYFNTDKNESNKHITKKEVNEFVKNAKFIAKGDKYIYNIPRRRDDSTHYISIEIKKPKRLSSRMIDNSYYVQVLSKNIETDKERLLIHRNFETLKEAKEFVAYNYYFETQHIYSLIDDKLTPLEKENPYYQKFILWTNKTGKNPKKYIDDFNRLNGRAKDIYVASIIHYANATDKKEKLQHIKDMLEKQKSSMKNIGMGYDEDMVNAGELFIKIYGENKNESNSISQAIETLKLLAELEDNSKKKKEILEAINVLELLDEKPIKKADYSNEKIILEKDVNPIFKEKSKVDGLTKRQKDVISILNGIDLSKLDEEDRDYLEYEISDELFRYLKDFYQYEVIRSNDFEIDYEDIDEKDNLIILETELKTDYENTYRFTFKKVKPKTYSVIFEKLTYGENTIEIDLGNFKVSSEKLDVAQVEFDSFIDSKLDRVSNTKVLQLIIEYRVAKLLEKDGLKETLIEIYKDNEVEKFLRDRYVLDDLENFVLELPLKYPDAMRVIDPNQIRMFKKGGSVKGYSPSKIKTPL